MLLNVPAFFVEFWPFVCKPMRMFCIVFVWSFHSFESLVLVAVFILYQTYQNFGCYAKSDLVAKTSIERCSDDGDQGIAIHLGGFSVERVGCFYEDLIACCWTESDGNELKDMHAAALLYTLFQSLVSTWSRERASEVVQLRATALALQSSHTHIHSQLAC